MPQAERSGFLSEKRHKKWHVGNLQVFSPCRSQLDLDLTRVGILGIPILEKVSVLITAKISIFFAIEANVEERLLQP